MKMLFAMQQGWHRELLVGVVVLVTAATASAKPTRRERSQYLNPLHEIAVALRKTPERSLDELVPRYRKQLDGIIKWAKEHPKLQVGGIVTTYPLGPVPGWVLISIVPAEHAVVAHRKSVDPRPARAGSGRPLPVVKLTRAGVYGGGSEAARERLFKEVEAFHAPSPPRVIQSGWLLRSGLHERSRHAQGDATLR